MPKKQKGGGGQASNKIGEYTTRLDPSEIRFTHSKIRPIFSDGRLVQETLAEIEAGTLNPDNLRNITVVQQDGFFVSMNNRRLWVLKAARANGFLKDGKIPVRVQQVPQTKRLKDRFEIDKCSLTATFMRERVKKVEVPLEDLEDSAGAANSPADKQSSCDEDEG